MRIRMRCQRSYARRCSVSQNDVNVRSHESLAKAILVRSFQDNDTKVECSTEVSYYQPTTWAFWRNLII